MNTIWSILSFAFGFLAGILFFSLILLPLFYGLPKSIYYYLKGVLKPGAIFFYLFALMFWVIVLIVLGFILQLLAPSVNRFLIFDSRFVIGQWLGIIFSILRSLTSSGRADLRDDFNKKAVARYHV
jgi:hypothetical protein